MTTQCLRAKLRSARQPTQVQALLWRCIPRVVALIALALGSGLAMAEPVVMELTQMPSASYEQERTQIHIKWPDFRATGLYAAPGAVVQVQVEGNPKGSSQFSLVVGTYDRQEFALQVGRNAIAIGDAKGMVFVRYTKDSPPFYTAPVRLTFGDGVSKVPHYRLGHTTSAQWLAALEALSDAPEVMLESRRAMVVYARANALAWKDQDQDLVLQSIDKVIDAQAAISGFDTVSELHRPVAGQMLMVEVPSERMPPGAGAFATDYFTAFTERTGTLKNAFTPMLVSNGWGTYHELGHTHQQYWTWREIVEVNVNIYSLAAQRALRPNNASVINPDKDLERKLRAVEFLGSKDPEKYFNDRSLGLFPRLYMFRQLWKAYGDAFFIKLHRMVREEKPKFDGVQDRMAYFARKASRISGNDLSPFFINWGFKLDQAVYDEIRAMKLPPPSTEPSTLNID